MEDHIWGIIYEGLYLEIPPTWQTIIGEEKEYSQSKWLKIENNEKELLDWYLRTCVLFCVIWSLRQCCRKPVVALKIGQSATCSVKSSSIHRDVWGSSRSIMYSVTDNCAESEVKGRWQEIRKVKFPLAPRCLLSSKNRKFACSIVYPSATSSGTRKYTLFSSLPFPGCSETKQIT